MKKLTPQVTVAGESKLERGQTIVLVALALVSVIAFVGLATDVTLIYTAQRHLQRAVDSAALAAANKLPREDEATRAAFEFTRLHGYDFETEGQLTVTFPEYDPPRKVAEVVATVPVDLAFLRVIGWRSTEVTALGEAESAPLDVYLVLDTSMSMVYDTPIPPSCPDIIIEAVTQHDWSCVADHCNQNRHCDPLDRHVKPAANYFLELLRSNDSVLESEYDRVGVVHYDREGGHVISLTHDFQAVADAVDDLDASNVWGKSTNIGDGIMYAHQHLASEGRLDAVWAVVLLTDGRANRYRPCGDCPPPLNCEGEACNTCGSCTTILDDDHGGPLANGWAMDHAQDTWDRHEASIYTIAYGDIFDLDPTYQRLMIQIADYTDDGGEETDLPWDERTANFWRAPDEAGLRIAFGEIADRIYTRLLR